MSVLQSHQPPEGCSGSSLGPSPGPFVSPIEVTAWSGELELRRKERPSECPGGVQSRCLPARLPHALFLGHSFQLPFLLLIVESVPGLGAAGNRRKQVLMEGLNSTHLSLGRRLKGPSLLHPSGAATPGCDGAFPPSWYLPTSAFFSVPSPLWQFFLDKERNSLACLCFVQSFPPAPAGMLMF